MPRIINDPTIDQELNKFAVRTFHAEAQKWIRTVAKQHIVNLDGTDRDQNFRVYAPPSESVYGGLPMFDSLPDWAKEAFNNGEQLCWFDPIQVKRRRIWQIIDNIAIWFNRNHNRATDTNYEQLEFAEAAQLSTEWREAINRLWTDNYTAGHKAGFIDGKATGQPWATDHESIGAAQRKAPQNLQSQDAINEWVNGYKAGWCAGCNARQ